MASSLYLENGRTLAIYLLLRPQHKNTMTSSQVNEAHMAEHGSAATTACCPLHRTTTYARLLCEQTVRL